MVFCQYFNLAHEGVNYDGLTSELLLFETLFYDVYDLVTCVRVILLF